MLVLLLLLCLSLPAIFGQGDPEQVHLFFAGDETKMHVSYVTVGAGSTSESVIYGLSPDQLTNTATATSTVLAYSMTTPIRLHEADMVNLSPGTVYYAVGDPGSASAATVYNFTVSPSRADGSIVYLVTADMGMVNGVDSGQVLEPMIANIASYDYWVMPGDYAYDLEDNGGELGNEFMRAVEPIAATIPLQVVAGNHEKMPSASDPNNYTFAHYLARFGGAGATAGVSSGSLSSRYYSLNIGLVHWVALDTEVFAYGTQAEADAQQTWLDADLAAVDREATPWVIAYGHKSYYMKNTNFSGFLPSFHTGNVSMFVSGHQHNYNRLFPIGGKGVPHPECVTGNVYHACDARTTFIVSGSSGCSGGIDTGLAPDGATATSSLTYGYGLLTVYNATTLKWVWTQTGTAAEDGSFLPLAKGVQGFVDEIYQVNY